MGVVGRAATVAGAVKGSSGRHPLGKRLAAVLPMLRDTFTGRWSNAPKGKVLAGVAGIAYVLSPLDILPEFLQNAPRSALTPFSRSARAGS